VGERRAPRAIVVATCTSSDGPRDRARGFVDRDRARVDDRAVRPPAPGRRTHAHGATPPLADQAEEVRSRPAAGRERPGG